MDKKHNAKIISKNTGLNRKQRRALDKLGKIKATKGYKKIRGKIFIGEYDVTRLIKAGYDSNRAYCYCVEQSNLANQELLEKSKSIDTNIK